MKLKVGRRKKKISQINGIESEKEEGEKVERRIKCIVSLKVLKKQNNWKNYWENESLSEKQDFKVSQIFYYLKYTLNFLLVFL